MSDRRQLFYGLALWAAVSALTLTMHLLEVGHR